MLGVQLNKNWDWAQITSGINYMVTSEKSWLKQYLMMARYPGMYLFTP